MTSKPTRKFIEIEAPRPNGARFFELRAPKTIIPCGLRVDTASAKGVKLVSFCVDDQEQLTQSLDAELFNADSQMPELDLATLPMGKSLDLTFTGNIKKIHVCYREPVVGRAEQVLRPGITRRAK